MNRTPPRDRDRAELTHILDGCSPKSCRNRHAPPTWTVQEKVTRHGATAFGWTESLLSRQIRPPPRTDHRRSHSFTDRIAAASFQLFIAVRLPGTAPIARRDRQPGTHPSATWGNISRSCMNGQEILDRKPGRSMIHAQFHNSVTVVRITAIRMNRRPAHARRLGPRGSCGSRGRDCETYRSGRKRPSWSSRTRSSLRASP